MFSKIIAKEMNLKEKQIQSVINLLSEGNTIPFIARYRKEATGELDEVVLRQIEERLTYLKNLQSRKEEVMRLIGEQGKLTEELEKAIKCAEKLQQVEDLYLPYRQKRRTRATIAKEKGLEPLAQIIIEQQTTKGNIEEIVKPYINPEEDVTSIEDAIRYASDIVAEMISDDAEIRAAVRKLSWQKGKIASAGLTEESSPYEMYYNYSEPVLKIPPHRLLAINRGEKEEVLQVKIEVPQEEIEARISQKVVKIKDSIFNLVLKEAIADGYKRLIMPAIEREIRAELTVKGEEQAIMVFRKNLRQLLLQPPVKGKIVLGVDPSYRTGCKLAVVDDTGKLMETGIIYPHEPQNKWTEAKQTMKKQIKDYGITTVAIGNGTASRETEKLVAEMIKELKLDVQYIIISEAGASVYSASQIAREEFPQFDLSLRSAISIARRLQDPLAELVKIDPKAIGVGQYQHDVTPKKLNESLEGVVEDCVNQVGVDLNTASAALLKYVAGLNSTVAKNIIAFREEKGKFTSRNELTNVTRLGKKSYTQCAGFIRIHGGKNPLENTPVHPESYSLAEAILKQANCELADLTDNTADVRLKLKELDPQQVAEKLGAGEPTVRDIFEALQKPGRDPREDLPKPVLRSDVIDMENLKEGMILQGTVRNVVDFGAFVDIGVKQDGLIHISKLTDKKYIKHPMEVIAVGDIVQVKIISLDTVRGRIGLSMREEDLNSEHGANITASN